MAPRHKKSAPQAPSQTLVLDNGGYTLKAGLVPTSGATPSYADCSVIPNCIARSKRDNIVYVASELERCRDFGELAFRRPVERGFIVNWEAQKGIWEHEFVVEGSGSGKGDGLRVV